MMRCGKKVEDGGENGGGERIDRTVAERGRRIIVGRRIITRANDPKAETGKIKREKLVLYVIGGPP